jgi:hypothetical protein
MGSNIQDEGFVLDCEGYFEELKKRAEAYLAALED